MRRILLVLTLLMALLAMPAAAFAQDAPAMPPVPCGNLSDDDCTFLQDSQAANQKITSFDSAGAIDLVLTDIPGLPSDVSIGLVTESSIAFAPEFMEQALELQAKMRDPETDPTAMIDDMMAMGVGFYANTNFDVTLDLTLSEDVAALLSQQAGVAIPETLNLPTRLVDGFFYANLDDLAQVVPGLSGWIGFDMVGLITASLEQSAALDGGMGSMEPAMMGAMIGGSLNTNPALQAALDANTMVERLDDTTVGDVDAAQFLHTFDMGGFLADPAVIALILQQAQAQMAMQAELGQEAPMTDADIQMVADMLPMLAPMLLSGLQWETINTIGLDDLYTYATETNIEWDLGSVIGMAGAVLGEGAVPAISGSPYFAFNMTSDKSNINGEVTIEAPEGAVIIPLDQMTGADSSM